MSEQKIYEVLPQLMRKIGAITKDRTNQHQRYQFRGIDDVLNAVGPACAELGVCVSPTIHDHKIERETYVDQYDKEKFRVHATLKLRLEFVASDGSKHVAEAIGEAMDTQGDKATNKAMSIAFKYACFMGLVIPVEGALDDSDHDDKQPEGKAKKTAPKPVATPTAKPLPNEECEKMEDWKVKGDLTLGAILADEETTAEERGEKLKTVKDLYRKKADEAATEKLAEYFFKGETFVKAALSKLAEPF